MLFPHTIGLAVFRLDAPEMAGVAPIQPAYIARLGKQHHISPLTI